jgi:hypothetical protein
MQVKEHREAVQAKYPDASLYVKNRYCYVSSPSYPGLTIGSGETIITAWQTAYDVVIEGEN